MPIIIPVVIKGAIGKLSELIIDVDKDWENKSITNMNMLIVGDIRVDRDLYLPNIPEVTPEE